VIGRRVYPNEDGNLQLEPGDYGLLNGTWYGKCPTGLTCNLANHTILEHPNGTITARPSIGIRRDKSPPDWDWHGWLEHGVWREV
jgi:hypothetical protein